MRITESRLRRVIRSVLLESYKNPMSAMYFDIGDIVVFYETKIFGKVLKPTNISEEEVYPSMKFAGYWNREDVISAEDLKKLIVRQGGEQAYEDFIEDTWDDSKNMGLVRGKNGYPMFPTFDILIYDTIKNCFSTEVISVKQTDRVMTIEDAITFKRTTSLEESDIPEELKEEAKNKRESESFIDDF